jgi:hypothetical protein
MNVEELVRLGDRYVAALRALKTCKNDAELDVTVARVRQLSAQIDQALEAIRPSRCAHPLRTDVTPVGETTPIWQCNDCGETVPPPSR